jgi:hypothetical protein
VNCMTVSASVSEASMDDAFSEEVRVGHLMSQPHAFCVQREFGSVCILGYTGRPGP